jgi:hypothetical protein
MSHRDHHLFVPGHHTAKMTALALDYAASLKEHRLSGTV